MGFIMLKSSQTQITQLKNYLIVFSVTYGIYVKSSEFIKDRISRKFEMPSLASLIPQIEASPQIILDSSWKNEKI